MEALKIIESYKEELTENNIVITSYYAIPSLDIVECIPVDFSSQYPDFELIEVSPDPYPSPSGWTENNL